MERREREKEEGARVTLIVTIELAVQAIVTAAFVLVAISMPKLVSYLVWTIYKILVFKYLSKIVRSKSMKRLFKGDFYEELVKHSDNPFARTKSMIGACADYLRDVKEPLVEAVTAVVLIVIISTNIALEHPLPIIFLMVSALLIVFIIASLSLIWIIAKEVNKLKKETQKVNVDEAVASKTSSDKENKHQ